MTVGLSGPAFNLMPGNEHDFDEAEALRLIERGYAVPVAEVPREKAVRRRPAAEQRKG